MYYSEKRTGGRGLTHFLTAAGIGAALTYYLDPDVGKRRRSLVRNQAVHAASKTVKAIDVSLRDVGHRIYGAFAELRSSLKSGLVPDEILIERIRSKMGRHVAHPSAIEVFVHNGLVKLKGDILDGEQRDLLSAIRSVLGVKDVESSLEVHKSSENIPRLQRGVRHTGEHSELMEEKWSPATRLVAGATGCAMIVSCLSRRTPAAIWKGTVGFGLLLRALTNIETKNLYGMGHARRGFDQQKNATSSSRDPSERIKETVKL